MCPDDRADWPIFPNCKDTNASSTDCATESLLYTKVSNFTLHTSSIELWNDTKEFLQRTNLEIEVLNALQMQSIKMHGNWDSTNTLKTVDHMIIKGGKKGSQVGSSPQLSQGYPAGSSGNDGSKNDGEDTTGIARKGVRDGQQSHHCHNDTADYSKYCHSDHNNYAEPPAPKHDEEHTIKARRPAPDEESVAMHSSRTRFDRTSLEVGHFTTSSHIGPLAYSSRLTHPSGMPTFTHDWSSKQARWAAPEESTTVDIITIGTATNGPEIGTTPLPPESAGATMAHDLTPGFLAELYPSTALEKRTEPVFETITLPAPPLSTSVVVIVDTTASPVTAASGSTRSSSNDSPSSTASTTANTSIGTGITAVATDTTVEATSAGTPGMEDCPSWAKSGCGPHGGKGKHHEKGKGKGKGNGEGDSNAAM